MDRRLGGPQSPSEHCREEKVLDHTNCAIPAPSYFHVYEYNEIWEIWCTSATPPVQPLAPHHMLLMAQYPTVPMQQYMKGLPHSFLLLQLVAIQT
jgi:hypothetical protein